MPTAACGHGGGQVAAIVALGLAIRLAAVLARPHLVAGGDAAEYLGQANLLAEGKGFIEPLIYAATHQAVQTAKLPPLYIMVLSLCSLAGFKGFLAHRVWSAIIGASAVGLAAVVGKELAGPRVGLLAALLVAVDPNLWINDSLGMSETLTPVLVLLVLWAAYRMRRHPGPASAAWLGAAIGLAALGRDELILLAPLHAGPAGLGRAARTWSGAAAGAGRRRPGVAGRGRPVDRVQHDPVYRPGADHRSLRCHPGGRQLRPGLAGAAGRLLVV